MPIGADPRLGSAPAFASPLGVRADAGLTDEQLRILTSIERFDLEPVRDRLIKEGAMPGSWVDEAILEFRRYFSLRVATEEPIYMPSKQIDQVWHACLVHTRLYAAFCEETYGYFVHHDPVRAPDLPEAWRSFEEPYRRLYGEPGRLWQLWKPS
jgi:hypothetical protein